jgi:hypothetical protein
MRSGRVWAGICLGLLALAWPAQQAAAAVRADTGAVQAVAAARADTPAALVTQDAITVSPGSVSGGQGTTLAFTYAEPAGVSASTVTVTVLVPDGWPAPTAPGIVSCASCQRLSTSGMAITASFDLSAGQEFVVDYTVTAPTSPGSYAFTAAAQYPAALVVPVTPESLPVAVSCPDGQGTMAGAANSVVAGSTVSLSFSYQAGSCGTGPGGAVTLTVPAGWTTPGTTPGTTAGATGFVTSTGGSGPPTTDGQIITVPASSLGPGATVSIDYEQARAPTVPAGYTFAAAEQYSDDGNLAALATSPEITVTPTGPQTGQSSSPSQAGVMTVRPARVLAAHPSTLTFRYQAPRTGLPPSSEITVEVPAGWTAPSASASPGQLGYARSGKGVLSVAGRQLVVGGVTLAGGQDLTITYTGRAAPSAAGQSTFVASVRSGRAAQLTDLAASPSVTVALAGAAGGPGQWPVILLVIGLVAAAASAGVLVRRLIHGDEGFPPPSVRATPHPGAAASVVVRDTGKRPTLTVHIEPHASAVSTTIRKARL